MTRTPSPKKLTPFYVRTKELKKESATLFIRIHTRKIDVLVSTILQVEVADWQKATASPRAWLAHQKKNYQLHAKLTQIEGIVKAHLAKVNFDREALDMDVRYISEPEKVDAERRAMEEAAEAERKAIAKYEGFDPLHKFGWTDIDRAFVSRYINYLQKHGYMAKVVNKHLTNLKALINAAFVDGVHDNFETTRKGTRIIRLVQQKTKTEVTIPILNENLITICEKYGYNIPKANEQVLNRYIKNILKDLSEQLPSLKEKVPTKLTMKQKEALKKAKKEPETDLNGNVVMPRYECVTSHTARRTGITNMYLSHRYTILQMMHVSGQKTQKTFMDYIKLSSEEIADEIAAMSKKKNEMW